MLGLFLDIATTYLVIRIALIALMLVAAVYIIVVVMQQTDNSEGLGAIGGQTAENESFYGKNKTKSKEHRQKVLTIISAVVLAVCAILFFIFAKTPV